MRNLSCLLAVAVMFTACHKAPPAEEKKEETPRPDPLASPKPAAASGPTAPKGIPYDPPPSKDNPWTADKAALGKQLFFDKRLSKDGSAACESCHYQDKGWTDNLPFSTKVGGEVNTRNTPSLYNIGYATAFYLDGRAPTLEANIAAAWKGQLGADPAVVATTLASIPGYKDAFQKVFNEAPTPDNVPKALAAYLRTIVSGNSKWDQYEAGDKSAVSADAIAGYTLFTGKAQCVLCHVPPLYSDGLFHNVGLEAGKAKPDVGRFKVTNDPKDTSAFKTGNLRGALHSAPYFHDASAATLEDAVKFMAGGGKPDPNLDQRLKPANLNEQELKQLVAFLQALGDTPDTLEKPTLP